MISGISLEFPYLMLLFQNIPETKLSISIIQVMVTKSLFIACLHKIVAVHDVSDLSNRT